MNQEQQKKEVAVVIPVYTSNMTIDEQISFDRCLKILSNYPIILVAPKNLKLDNYLEKNPSIDFKIYRFNQKFFKSIYGYNKLTLSKIFYEKFVKYKYILIYQLDALVFSDSLSEWCASNYDYVGAPWILSPSSDRDIPTFIGIGNGGFSLRKVESFLKVLSSQKIDINNYNLLYKQFNTVYGLRYLILARILHKIQEYLWGINILKLFLFFYNSNEDVFWSYYARLFYPEFKIPSVKAALNFAYECHPNYCFEQNNQQLPFGCHGWYKYDREFWVNFLNEDYLQ